MSLDSLAVNPDEAVAAGLDLLNRVFPDAEVRLREWARKGYLQVQFPTRCPLAVGSGRWFIDVLDRLELTSVDTLRFGFSASDQEGYCKLQDAWMRALTGPEKD